MSFDLPSWYKDFERHTFYTLFLDNLPDDFYDYLGEDGVILSGNVPESSFDREYESDWSDEGGEVSLAPPEARFPDLHAAIKKAIEELGGRVLPKLGHSAPKVKKFFFGSSDISSVGWCMGFDGRHDGLCRSK